MGSNRYLVLISDTHQTCGVEEFSRLLAARFEARAVTHRLDFNLPNLFRSLKGVDGLVVNFPVVAWKKKLLEPLLAACTARLSGKGVHVILHEWSALDWKRRLVLSPVVLLATELCFSAPEIEAEFESTGLAKIATGNRTVIPIPPNLSPPEKLIPGAFAEKLRSERANGRLIIGQFGSIYPQKQVSSVLSVAADLKKRGTDVFVAFAGSFIKGLDNVEEDFFAAVKNEGLSGQVAVSGFIGSEEELFAIFQEVDVFCYLLPGGLTARRGSVLTAAASGKPVVVNAPSSRTALAHHSLFQRLIETGSIQLVPTDAGIPATADAVLTAQGKDIGPSDIASEVDRLWDDVIIRMDHRAG
ncbi:glycosyltransferase [Roseibium sp.]|uniref:glycosyltransferase n=1 Tax=Roseibium sp. TaxID=1936156 RepID=UPI003D14ABCF